MTASDQGGDAVPHRQHSRAGHAPARPRQHRLERRVNDVGANKRSISLNPNTPRGIELTRELVAQSDVVTNNFTGDRMERWGLGYDDLRKVKDDIILLTMPVMGTTEPNKRYGSYGNGVIAFGGLTMNMGLPDRPPIGIEPLHSDFSAPYFTVSAAMAAPHHRARTGEG
jgi:benzylsuccinate CoA-transferase BbsF subunit